VAGQVVLFGATGVTGRLTAAAMVRRGVRPVLAGRSAPRLAELAEELGGLSWRVADASDAASVRGLLGRGDVLVSTVGPFTRFGAAAVQAAAAVGAAYFDSTGEPAFLRRVFVESGPAARAAGCALVPAFGYDFVPGNLAAALALRQAPDATRVDVGYFVKGPARPGWLSHGTLASTPSFLLDRSHAWRGGRLVAERTALRVRSFRVAGRARAAISVGGSEHLALPRLAPGLQDVGVYLGWAGPLSRLAQLACAVLAGPSAVPPVRRGLVAASARLLPRLARRPQPRQWAGVRSLTVAEAYGAGGATLASVTVEGPNPYDLTAELLAWGAQTAAAGGLAAVGAVGPVEAFGLETLTRGCAGIGLVEVG
jgi:short subunit dehydrogenase-like uncharacterized protein